jgi:hypothetical protein
MAEVEHPGLATLFALSSRLAFLGLGLYREVVPSIDLEVVFTAVNEVRLLTAGKFWGDCTEIFGVRSNMMPCYPDIELV